MRKHTAMAFKQQIDSLQTHIGRWTAETRRQAHGRIALNRPKCWRRDTPRFADGMLKDANMWYNRMRPTKLPAFFEPTDIQS